MAPGQSEQYLLAVSFCYDACDIPTWDLRQHNVSTPRPDLRSGRILSVQCTGKTVRWMQTMQSNLPMLTLASTGLKEVLLTATLTYITVL